MTFVIYVIKTCNRIYAKILKLIIILAQRTINTGERTLFILYTNLCNQAFIQAVLLMSVFEFSNVVKCRWESRGLK